MPNTVWFCRICKNTYKVLTGVPALCINHVEVIPQPGVTSTTKEVAAEADEGWAWYCRECDHWYSDEAKKNGYAPKQCTYEWREWESKHEANPTVLRTIFGGMGSVIKKGYKPTAFGTKFDAGKAPISFIPYEALQQTSYVFAYGAKKYPENNYKYGMNWSRVVDACFRHLSAFNEGELVDPESALTHLGCVMANAAILIYYVKHNAGTDDRHEVRFQTVKAQTPKDPYKT